MMYRFRHRLLRTIVAIPMLLGTAVLMWQRSTNDNSGLIIDSIIRLPAQDATVLLRGMAVAIFIIAVCGGFISIVRGLQGDQRIVLGIEGVIVPKPGLIKSEMSLSYDTINRLRVSAMSTRFTRIRYLEIKHARGRFTMSDRALGSGEEFDDLSRQLDQRVKRAKAAPHGDYGDARRFG